ncbi:MAG: DUF4145 domain-containing protein [Methanosarcinaceae archaeon]|nr:DUF4145 domain-containing protein [Methanosarcinaceae archaeon]
MKIKVKGQSNQNHVRAHARCPHCGKEAVFENIGQHDFSLGDNIVCGQRKCPNPSCNGHLFVVFKNGQLVASYPPIKLDFDATSIPENIKNTFEEALVCHSSGCYVASAIMVRRTLEGICEDKAAQGNNLKTKLADLESKIVLPKELLDAMDELRLLGNDAAHIEAKQFNAISNVELEVAIEVTKEIMKALYQYSSLLSKLRALKKNA